MCGACPQPGHHNCLTDLEDFETLLANVFMLERCPNSVEGFSTVLHTRRPLRLAQQVLHTSSQVVIIAKGARETRAWVLNILMPDRCDKVCKGFLQQTT